MTMTTVTPRSLVDASLAGDTTLLKQLLNENPRLDAADADDVTPLGAAASVGEVEVMKLLIHSGADPNFREEAGTIPLGLAALFGQKEAILFLLDNGADPNLEIDAAGNNALGAAALVGHTEIATLLRAHMDK